MVGDEPNEGVTMNVKISVWIIALTVLLAACSGQVEYSAEAENTTVHKTEDSLKDTDLTYELALSDNPYTQDINFMQEQLEMYHHDLYRNISETDFEEHVQELKDKTETMTDDGFRIEMEMLLARIGDGHTKVAVSESERFLPVQLRVYDDGTFIVGGLPAYADYIGWEVTGVGNVALSDVKETLSKTISYSTDAWRTSNMMYRLSSYSHLKYLGFGSSEDTIELQLRKGDRLSTLLLDEKVCPTLTDVRFRKFVRMKPLSNPILANNVDKNYSVATDEANGIIYVQYNRCRKMDEYSIQQLLQDMVAALEEGNKSIVIDMRNNSGGREMLFQPVITYLETVIKEQAVDVYLIVGNQTFSSGVLNAVEIAKLDGSVVVGEETGGAVNHFGHVTAFQLPNTGMTIQTSTTYYYRDRNVEGPLVPDYCIENTMEARVKGQDPFYDHVVRLVEERTAKTK